ncbi:hypothetical protein EJ02DRAFT_197834 [Clathrospora elynae]|uniref:Uncharacterized protein n=1 Tax=Clathrospora elynae TaxID=706981 RepID=A0A6A5T2I1_9PLEO|nr:hypothetical protein EJ02DRAFT_197834 [Clathrospora elynae]
MKTDDATFCCANIRCATFCNRVSTSSRDSVLSVIHRSKRHRGKANLTASRWQGPSWRTTRRTWAFCSYLQHALFRFKSNARLPSLASFSNLEEPFQLSRPEVSFEGRTTEDLRNRRFSGRPLIPLSKDPMSSRRPFGNRRTSRPPKFSPQAQRLQLAAASMSPPAPKTIMEHRRDASR